jgi:homoserine dehydrogenase
MRLHEGGYYMRLSVLRPAGRVRGNRPCMADAGISLESIVQRRNPVRDDAKAEEGLPQPVILITYETTEVAVKEALEVVMSKGVVADKPQMIRIEKLK